MFGRMLRVDLTSGEMRDERIPDDFIRDYIGASALAARLLWDELDPVRDAFDPASPLLWITGPLTGTCGPTTGRFTICARSPQTGIWGEANIGGFVGPELRFAGYDALWIQGRSRRPVTLWVHAGQAELLPADHLWGQTDTYVTQQRIREELDEPRAKVACIGLAGENRVTFAGIFTDHGRSAARTGMGAVMGSKNLKAVAVRGTGKIPLARPEDYKVLRVAANKALVEENLTAVFRETGTSGSLDYLQLLGDMPQRFWTQAVFENASAIGGATMAETILTGTSACQGCVISCGRVVTISDGPYALGKTKGPEYETICSFGSQLLVDDLALVTALGKRCDELGMDTISAGNIIAQAYLMYERGYLTDADTGGLALHFGDGQPCFRLLDQMARCEGFGSLLAQGSRALARRYGADELAVEVANLEVPMHDPRANTGQALSYVTSPRGACHNQSDYFMVEMGSSVEELGIPMTERFVDSGKAHFVARHQDYRTVCNALVVCFFAATPPSTLVELLSAASGLDWTLDEMMKAGERAWNLKRLINLRLGWMRDQEKLPPLLLQPLPDGGQMGTVPDMQVLLEEYYAARGWDPATGGPLADKLRELGLEFTKAVEGRR